MGPTESRWLQSRSRRRALVELAGLFAAPALAASAARAQQDPRPLKDHKRMPGLDEMMNAFDFEPVMFANVPLSVYDYTAHGDGSEFTLRRNREAFDWVEILPVSRTIDPALVNLSSTLFGEEMKFPILIAPSATMVPVHPEGEVGMHRAATAASNTLMVVSQNASMPIDRVADAAKGPIWFQFYPQQDAASGRAMLERAQGAGAKAVVVTIDQQASYYERTQQDRNLGGNPRVAPRVAPPTTLTGAARYRISTGRLWYTWEHLEQIRKFVKVPMLIKGILTAEDARLCVEHGMDGVIVSNHGGRSMDYGPSTLEVLPEVVAAVNRRVPVITDSGYRRGADILKAIALGADAVMLGRAPRWALGAFGPPGVERLLHIMQRELVTAAAAAGCANLSTIGAVGLRANFL